MARDYVSLSIELPRELWEKARVLPYKFYAKNINELFGDLLRIMLGEPPHSEKLFWRVESMVDALMEFYEDIDDYEEEEVDLDLDDVELEEGME